MATKPGRMVTCYYSLLPIMSHDPYSCGLPRSRDKLTECLWSPQCYSTLWSRDLVRSCEKLK